MCGTPVSIKADIFVRDKDTLKVGNLELTFIHTPGHTKGGMCIYTAGHLFSGDTLFRQSIGRSDFYGGDYNELLNIEDKIGNIVDLSGKVLGTHKGIWNYTIGQRKGLGIAAAEPLYVLELRKDTNEVVVGFADKTFKNSLVANKLNWIAIDKLTEEMNVTAKIRSTQQPVPVKIIPIGDDEVKVVFEDAQKSIAIGQSAVFYQDDVVLGGGIIASVE